MHHFFFVSLLCSLVPLCAYVTSHIQLEKHLLLLSLNTYRQRLGNLKKGLAVSVSPPGQNIHP